MVERAGLENRCGCKPTVGSNPTSSADKSGQTKTTPAKQGGCAISRGRCFLLARLGHADERRRLCSRLAPRRANSGANRSPSREANSAFLIVGRHPGVAVDELNSIRDMDKWINFA